MKQAVDAPHKPFVDQLLEERHVNLLSLDGESSKEVAHGQRLAVELRQHSASGQLTGFGLRIPQQLLNQSHLALHRPGDGFGSGFAQFGKADS